MSWGPKTVKGCYRAAILEAAAQDMNPHTHTNNGGFPTTTVAVLISNVFAVPFSKIHKDIKRIVGKAGAEFKGLIDTDSPEFKEWWKKQFGE